MEGSTEINPGPSKDKGSSQLPSGTQDKATTSTIHHVMSTPKEGTFNSSDAQSTSTIVRFQKGVISSLVRVVTGNLQHLQPQTVKQNLADIVKKLCGEEKGKIFSACFEGDKWGPEDELVNLICDWMKQAGIEQNEKGEGKDAPSPLSNDKMKLGVDVNEAEGAISFAGGSNIIESGRKLCLSTPYDKALYDLVAEVVCIPPGDFFKTRTIMQFPFTNSTREIAVAIFIAIATTDDADMQATLSNEVSTNEYPLIPRFASLFTLVRHVMSTCPQHHSLVSDLCQVFCEQVLLDHGEELLENEDLIHHVGRLFGTAANNYHGLDIEAVLVTFGGVKGPYLYSLMYGMLCDDGGGIFPSVTQISRWEHLDPWVKGILITIMSGPSFTDAKWRGALLDLIMEEGLGTLIPVDKIFERSLFVTLNEVTDFRDEKKLRDGGRLVAMMMVHMGWEWIRQNAFGVLEDYEELWSHFLISDAAFAQAVVLAIGTAISWLRKENVPDDLSALKEEILKYKQGDYPVIIQAAADSAHRLLQNVLLKGETILSMRWTYEKTSHATTNKSINEGYMREIDELFFSQEYVHTSSSSSTIASTSKGMKLDSQEKYKEAGKKTIKRPVSIRHSIEEDPPSSAPNMLACSCKKKYKTVEGLLKHVQTENEKIFQCELCSDSFADHTALGIHFKDKHPGRKYIHVYFCFNCGNQYAKYDQLTDHLSSSTCQST